MCDITLKEDVVCATAQPNCQHLQYELEKLQWLEEQVNEIRVAWEETAQEAEMSDVEVAAELLEHLSCIKSKAASIQTEITRHIELEELWDVMEELLNSCKQCLRKLDHLQIPAFYCSILKATDAGPGVGVSNTEVRFRDAAIARIHASDRVNRIHRAHGDSAQNEAERTNASIGEALVDGRSLKWEYYKPFDGLTEEVIQRLSAKEVLEKESVCMEKNAWRVAEEVARRIDDEPGPAGDFMKSYTTSEKKRQFFFNRPYLMKYASTQSEKKRLDIPGCNYLKKIYTFIDAHFIVGEMFLEYLKGSCVNTTGTLCDYCSLNEKCCPGIDRVPRPFPDYESTGLHYLPMNKTPMANRITDDFHPRVQLKKAYVLGECTLDNPNKILEFSKKFGVSEECIRGNLEHLKLLDLKKDKRKKERAEKRSAQAGKKYEDFDWVAMLEDGSLTKQTIAVLDKYLRHHNIECQGRKKAKLNEVQRHITNHLAVTQNLREQDSDTDESEEDEVVTCDEYEEEEDILAEIGSVENEEEEYEEHEEGDEILYLDDHGIRMNVTTRSGRNATRFLLC